METTRTTSRTSLRSRMGHVRDGVGLVLGDGVWLVLLTLTIGLVAAALAGVF